MHLITSTSTYQNSVSVITEWMFKEMKELILNIHMPDFFWAFKHITCFVLLNVT